MSLVGNSPCLAPSPLFIPPDANLSAEFVEQDQGKSPLTREFMDSLFNGAEKTGEPQSSVPSLAVNTLLSMSPGKPETKVFHVKTEKVGGVPLSQLISTLAPILENPKAQALYESVFGESLPSLPPDIVQQREEASQKRGSLAVDQLTVKIEEACQKCNRLIREWSALPQTVREVFGNFSEVEIFHTHDSFMSALRAIQAYNLICVGIKLFPQGTAEFPFSRIQSLDEKQPEGWIMAGDIVAGKLQVMAGKLQTLQLQNAGITCLPKEITGITSLFALFLKGNFLVTLPPQMGNLGKLTVLDLSENRLKSLPKTMGQLCSLCTLDLSKNLITDVPYWLNNLKNIKKILLSGNKLAFVPDFLGKLTKRLSTTGELAYW